MNAGDLFYQRIFPAKAINLLREIIFEIPSDVKAKLPVARSTCIPVLETRL